jgi:hypothetical protein
LSCSFERLLVVSHSSFVLDVELQLQTDEEEAEVVIDPKSKQSRAARSKPKTPMYSASGLEPAEDDGRTEFKGNGFVVLQREVFYRALSFRIRFPLISSSAG